VQACPEGKRAWMILIAFVIDQVRCRHDRHRPSVPQTTPIRKAQSMSAR
jgi:hypothetical protein